MRSPTHFVLALLALVLAGLSLPALPVRAAAARLEFAGTVPPRQRAEALLAPALRSPRDSAVLVTALGDLAGSLQDQGWLDARARGAWNDGEPFVLALDVEAGPRYRLAEVVVRAANPADSLRVARALDLATGGWISPRRVGESVARAVDRLAALGFAYAELGVRGWDADSGRVRLTIAAAPGPEVVIGDVRVKGLVVTREDVVRRALGRLTGQHYDPAAALAGRERLLRLGLFRDARYEGLEGMEDWSRGRLVYVVEEPRYNAFEGVVGVQGDAGTVGRARVELGNLLGTGRAIALRWESAGGERSTLAARYAEPMLLGTSVGGQAALEHEVRDSTYTRTRWGGGFTWAATTREALEAGYDQERVVQGFGQVREARLENVRFALERAAWDDAAAPRRGMRARVEGAHVFKRERLRPLGSRTARASVVEAQLDLLRPLSPTSRLSLELVGAGRFSSERVLPVYERRALGGAASLRGFDEEAFRVDRFGLSRLEWRVDLGGPRQHAYAFWDHAWAATRVALAEGGDRLDLLHEDGVGFGLRLGAAGGTVGLDYGLEAGRPPLDGKIHVRLTSTF